MKLKLLLALAAAATISSAFAGSQCPVNSSSTVPSAADLTTSFAKKVPSFDAAKAKTHYQLKGVSEALHQKALATGDTVGASLWNSCKNDACLIDNLQRSLAIELLNTALAAYEKNGEACQKEAAAFTKNVQLWLYDNRDKATGKPQPIDALVMSRPVPELLKLIGAKVSN